MIINKLILLIVSHLCALAFGVAVGIYLLPIIAAPASPSATELTALSTKAQYTTKFQRDLKGSDFLHWGEGTVSLSQEYVTLVGKLAPGPEYRLYLSPAFVETEAEFEELKSSIKLVGDIKTFDNFMVKVGVDVDFSQYNTVIVWCEAFGEFITSAKYR